ncbi:hypothetical protein EMCRGX_G023629 [Ephydatia muelleri]
MRRSESEAVQGGSSAVSMNDGEEMIQQLVEKFHSTTVRSERLTVLTAVPKSWSVRKTAKMFNASRYLAGQAKRLVAEKGVLSSPNPSEDHGVNVAFEEVNKFYLSDDISRVMPGKKDFVSVRGADGKRVHRLLMCNLREAYREFKECNPALKVGRFNTDRSSLETKVQTVDELLDSFSRMLEKFLVHDLITKMQADFMREKKESLGPGEFLVVADFSENFSFVVQDEIQSFDWNNNSATLHPFHDVNAVHLFQRKLVNFLTQESCGGQLPKKICTSAVQICIGHIQGMHFGFATVQEHDEEAKMLQERHKMSRTVPGTQSLHSFIPLSACMVEVRQFFTSTICRAEWVVHSEGINCAPRTAIGIGGYVTVVYNEAYWLGCVLSVVESECVVTVKFLHPKLPSSSFVFPDQEDVMDIDPSDILTHVNPITTTGRTYTLSKTEIQEANCALAARQ